MKTVNVALVGLGFGGAFAEIYKAHPQVGRFRVFDTDQALQRSVQEQLGLDEGYHSFQEILEDPEIDAVHLVTPIPLHEQQSVQVLEAGKHCACTVPMATTLEGIRRITEAARRSGKNYMMMETTLYTYQFLYVQGLLAAGELGQIQFLRGSHYQDMSGWPEYWTGLPPMHYGTHAVAPVRVLAGAPARRVVCFGSGRMSPERNARYGNPFPVESALVEFENGMKAEVTRTLFETARPYQEGLFVYGSRRSFEWGFEDADAPLETVSRPHPQGKRGNLTETHPVALPHYAHLLPPELRPFTVGEGYDPLNPQESLLAGAGAGHHGSHPHLVHEFVSSILEERRPWIDQELGGNITAVGVCAHASALAGGVPVEIPRF